MKFILPSKVLDQHLVVLGKTGSGKSSVLRYLTEHLLGQEKRVCVIDIKGDWSGLKIRADGNARSTYPVIGFGDFKNPEASDVPINQHSGGLVAELVATGNRPCIIGFRGWMTAHIVQFWIDFAAGIFNQNHGELYLVGDEFHNLAPKGKIMDPQAGKCLHWSNRLLAEGRGLGIVCLIASQRPQKVHNDTLTSCETLVAMRVVHAADRNAVKEWIDGCGDPVQGRKVLDALAGLLRGEAYVWSPEAGFGPELVKFPMFRTFDSFAPPQLQKQVRTEDWSSVDLAEVRQKLAVYIQERESKDPAALKRRIHELETQLQTKPKAAPPVEVSVLTKDDREFLAGLHKEPVLEKLLELAGRITGAATQRSEGPVSVNLSSVVRLEQVKTPPAKATTNAMSEKVHAYTHTSRDLAIGGGIQRMMTALAQRPGLSDRQLGVRAQLSSKSGTFSTYLAKMRTNGWIEGTRSSMRLTAAGVEALGVYEPLPTGKALLVHWLAELGGGAARMLEFLADRYPDAISREELGQGAGISHCSGTFSTYMARLRTLELVENRGGGIKASDEFFT